MTPRFSDHELSFLRNKVPINQVIHEFLALTTRSRNGKLSFACPLCHGFNTSINARHNLARCFDCRQNFNPIEIVMHQLKIGFVDSVKWLKRHDHKTVNDATSASGNHRAAPVNVADILPDILPEKPSKNSATSRQQTIDQRVFNLEQRVRQLHLLIEELRTAVYQR
jgi:hypothetical protein